MGAAMPERFDPDTPILLISVAARLADMHPQTLRGYDRLGLVQPSRTAGRGRRYSMRDVQRLRLIQRLSQDEGINLEGIRRILELTDELEDLRGQVADLSDRLRKAVGGQHAPRVFTADGAGRIGLGRRSRWASPKQITSR